VAQELDAERIIESPEWIAVVRHLRRMRESFIESMKQAKDFPEVKYFAGQIDLIERMETLPVEAVEQDKLAREERKNAANGGE